MWIGWDSCSIVVGVAFVLFQVVWFELITCDVSRLVCIGFVWVLWCMVMFGSDECMCCVVSVFVCI